MDLFGALSSGLGDEAFYLQRDPYFMAGRSIASMPVPQAQNDAQAVIGPILMGLMGGGLMGYGRNNANQAAFADYRQSPLLAAMSDQYGARPAGAAFGPLTEGDAAAADAMPEGWTVRQGRQDLMLAAMQQQIAMEEAAKKRELLAQFSPEVLAGAQLKAEAEARGKAAGEGGGMGIPTNLQRPLLDEQASKDKLNRAFEFIDEQYEKATKVSGGQAWLGGITERAGVPTRAKQELDRIAESSVLQLDGILGRETNSDVRKRLIDQFGPKWYDSDDTKRQKGQDLKAALAALAAGTPLSDAITKAGGTEAVEVSSDAPPTPPAGFELTGKRDAAGNWGIRRKGT